MRIPDPGGGGTLVFNTYVSSKIFRFKVLNFNIFEGFQKNKINIFGGIFWGHHKIGHYLGVFSMHFMVFS